MAHFLTLQSVASILDRIREFSPLEAESAALDRSLGRTLAESFHAPEDLPGFDRSGMDGFAVRAKDVFGASEGLPALLDLVGECPMGAVPDISVGPGQAARIWTGGMLPRGADAVVMLEYARAAGTNQVELTRPVAPGDHVLAKDEDACQGQVLIPAGQVIRPQELGLLAAFGQQSVRVRRRPKVAVISTGDEVVPFERTPAPGEVRDVNTHTLAALAETAGAEARSFGLVPDDPQRLAKAVAEALEQADVLLVSGGSSAGRRDYTANAFSAQPGCGILAHGVAVSPGKPLIMARQGQKSLWGMPGHVASAFVCAEVFIRPLLERLLGRSHVPAIRRGLLQARLTRPVASAQGRRDYIRVALEVPERPGDMPPARPIMGKSGILSTLIMAEGLVVCPEDREGLDAGQIVSVTPLL